MNHLDDAHLLDLASGAASPAEALLARCAVAMRPDTARRYTTAEVVGGLYFEDAPEAPLSPSAFAAVLGLTTEAEADNARVAPPQTVSGRFPSPLEQALAEEQRGRLKWSRRPGGMSEIRLGKVSGDGVEARLVKLKPGGGVPRHDHSGEELTLVLSGAFRDESGRYQPGDVCEAGPGVDHHPRVEGDDDCVCLIVRRGAWRFRNPLYGLADRALGLF